MKIWNKLRVAVVLPAVLASFGCDDFLTTEPEQAVSNDAFFASIGDFRAAAIGLYDQMQDADWYGRSVPLMSDVMSEDIKLNGSANRYSEFADFLGVAITGHQYEIATWRELYEAINMANMMINADFEPRPAVEAEYRQLIGEAHAARALAYFDLVKLYGQHYTFTAGASHPGVPIVLEHDIDGLPARSTVAEVYTQVVSDFQTSLSMMSSARSGPFMFSPDAVRALLSRVHLYMEECEQSVAMADAVINSGKFSLTQGSSYVTQFADGGSSEAIFEIAYSSADNIGSDALGAMYRASGYGDYLPSRDLLDLIAAGDLRTQMFIEDSDLVGVYASHRVNKFPTTTNTDNVPVVRLSEVYLNRAEALQCLGRDQEAQADLNLIRQRANPAAPAVTATGQALLDEILVERRIELANEGHAVHDVMRHQRDIVRDDFTGAASVITYPCQFCILPIPFDELDVNPNITQNPGYGS